MRVVRFAGDGIKSIDQPDWSALLSQTDQGALWVDLVGPSDDDVRLMRDVFHFHPLAIEDTQDGRQRPKVEEYKDHLFIILNPVNEYKDDLTFRELDVFVTHSAIVTVHKDEHEPMIDEVMKRCSVAHRNRAKHQRRLLDLRAGG